MSLFRQGLLVTTTLISSLTATTLTSTGVVANAYEYTADNVTVKINCTDNQAIDDTVSGAADKIIKIGATAGDCAITTNGALAKKVSITFLKNYTGTITLRDAKLQAVSDGAAALAIIPGQPVTVKLEGENELTSGASAAGLQFSNASTVDKTNQSLTITATDLKAQLTATGGSKSAGIGGSYQPAEGRAGGGNNITIAGGTIVATGKGSRDYAAAGIGGAAGKDGSNIFITGGNITATGGSANTAAGAGIGGGGEDYDARGIGQVSIFGGTVTATGGIAGDTQADAIGTAFNENNFSFSAGTSSVYISGGSVKASPDLTDVTTGELAGVAVHQVLVPNAATATAVVVDEKTSPLGGAHTDTDSSLYLWLPANTEKFVLQGDEVVAGTYLVVGGTATKEMPTAAEPEQDPGSDNQEPPATGDTTPANEGDKSEETQPQDPAAPADEQEQPAPKPEKDPGSDNQEPPATGDTTPTEEGNTPEETQPQDPAPEGSQEQPTPKPEKEPDSNKQEQPATGDTTPAQEGDKPTETQPQDPAPAASEPAAPADEKEQPAPKPDKNPTTPAQPPAEPAKPAKPAPDQPATAVSSVRAQLTKLVAAEAVVKVQASEQFKTASAAKRTAYLAAVARANSLLATENSSAAELQAALAALTAAEAALAETEANPTPAAPATPETAQPAPITNQGGKPAWLLPAIIVGILAVLGIAAAATSPLAAGLIPLP